MKKRDLYYERIPTKFFRENVRYLGNILGKVIKEQEGQKFFIINPEICSRMDVRESYIHLKIGEQRFVYG